MGQSPVVGSPQPTYRRRAPRKGCRIWVKELPVFLTLLMLCSCFLAIAIIFGMDDHVPDERCSDIESINQDEQRVCRPRRTGSVWLSRSWPNLTAFRYAVKDLPDTVSHTTHWGDSRYIFRKSHSAHNFTLSAGGSVNFTFRTDGRTVDAYLMTLEQFREFLRWSFWHSEWSSVKSTHDSTVYTAKEAGIYVAVVAVGSTSVEVVQNMTVTTAVYKVSSSTAKETCTDKCALKGVHSDEVVVLEYTGDRDSVYVDVLSGDGPGDRTAHSFCVAFSVLAAVLALAALIAFVFLIRAIRPHGDVVLAPGAFPPPTEFGTTTPAGATPGATPAGPTPGAPLQDSVTAPLLSDPVNSSATPCGELPSSSSMPYSAPQPPAYA